MKLLRKANLCEKLCCMSKMKMVHPAGIMMLTLLDMRYINVMFYMSVSCLNKHIYIKDKGLQKGQEVNKKDLDSSSVDHELLQ